MYLDISVIIPTINRPNSLERTLQSIAKQKNIPGQIVIVDQSIEISFQKDYKRVISNQHLLKIDYLFLSEQSLTKARNFGMSKCIYDILVMMDDDVDIYDDIFDKLIKIYVNRQIAMIAGLDKLSIKNNSNSIFGYIFNLKSYKLRKIGHVTRSMRGRFPIKIDSRVDTMWAMGFFFSVRKSLIDKWNLSWNEMFESYAYAEDLDFSYNYYLNAKNEKLKCILDPQITVIHNVSQEYRIPSKRSIYMYIFHRLYLCYKFDGSIKGLFCYHWSNFGVLIESLISKKNFKYYLSAIKFAFLLREDIKKGKLHYELFL